MRGTDDDDYDEIDATMASRGRPVDLEYDSEEEIYAHEKKAAAYVLLLTLLISLLLSIFYLFVCLWHRAEEDERELPTEKQEIAPLPFIDHNQMDYEQFEKCFYSEPADIARMTEPEVHALRRSLGMCAAHCYCYFLLS